MAEKRWYKTKNGDYDVWTWEANCDRCGTYIHESYPRYEDGDEILCEDCAFIENRITEQEYIKEFLSAMPVDRVAIRDGVVYVCTRPKEKFPWEKTSRDIRNSEEYREWRRSVFERDNFACAICGKVGGSLEAHHIKPFAKYESSRFDIDNGITLCKACHKRVHKEKVKEWLYQEE